METLLDAPCFYFSATEDGTLTSVNGRLCEGLGYEAPELCDQKLDVIFTVATRIFFQTHFFPLLQLRGSAEEIYVTLKTKENKPLPLLINADRITSSDGKPTLRFVGIAVHNRKKFEDELVAAKKAAETALNENTALLQAKQAIQTQLEQLDLQLGTINRQNEELKQFNRVVTHDLQEPLRKLMVFTAMLQDSTESTARQKAAERIGAMSEDLRSIVSGLQQFVWLTDAEFKPAAQDLNELLRAARLRHLQENPGLAIHLDAAPLPHLDGDAEQLRFLFYELLKNAVRFRKRDAEVTVSVSGTVLQANSFRSVPGKYKYVPFLKLEIKDEGTGMNATYKDQALDLFRRLHTNSGRGVGLTLCKKIADNHGGSLALESAEGRGTTVVIWLPCDGTGRNTTLKTAEKLAEGEER